MVNYILIMDDKSVIEKRNEACYSYIHNKGVPKNTKYIVFEQRFLTISEELLKKYHTFLRKTGFIFKYYPPNKKTSIYNECLDKHRWIIDIKNYQNIFKLLYFSTALRYAFEEGLESFINGLFEVNLKRKNMWFKWLYIHNKTHSGVHTLHESTFSLGYYPLEQLKNVFNKEYSVYDKKPYYLSEIFNINKKKINKKNIVKSMENKFNVYIVGGDNAYATWINKDYNITKKMEDADVVIFTGGEDVDPSMYGEKKGNKTYSNLERDIKEKKEFKKASKLNVLKIGICRGAQFLGVMSGCSLIQDQPNPSYEHNIVIKETGKLLPITSTHHQAINIKNIPSYNYNLIAVNENLLPFHLDGNNEEIDVKTDVEIIYFYSTKSLCIQGHPEYMDKECETVKFLNKLLNQHL